MSDGATVPPGWQQPPAGPRPAPQPTPDIGYSFTIAWRAFRDHVATMLVAGTVLLIVSVVPLLLLVPLWIELVTIPDRATSPDLSGTSIVLALVTIPVLVLVVPIFQANLTRVCLEVLDGATPGPFAILRFRRFGATLGTEVLIGLGTFVGFLLCLVPGLLVSWASAFAYQLVHDRGLGPVAAIKGSFAIVRQRLGVSLVAILLAGLLASTGSYACWVGMIATAPLAQLFLCHQYRQIIGTMPD